MCLSKVTESNTTEAVKNTVVNTTFSVNVEQSNTINV